MDDSSSTEVRPPTITVTDEHETDSDVAFLATLVATVLREQGYPATTEVAVTLVADEQMATLHETHLGLAGPTDVLSFPIEDLEPGVVPDVDETGPPVLLGDIVIAPDHVARQAAEHGSTVSDEMALMVVHGMLHLMGWDHIDDTEAEAMELRETELLALHGVRRR